MENEVGFILYLENGLLSMLEGYSVAEPWPDIFDSFTLRYRDQERKDFLGIVKDL